jgi:hypothetical protein
MRLFGFSTLELVGLLALSAIALGSVLSLIQDFDQMAFNRLGLVLFLIALLVMRRRKE